MSFFAPPPPPATGLGRYRVLSPLAGIRVSPLQLGAMSIGDKWKGMGAMNKESSFKLLDAYYEKGGNFIDTANGYQDEASEELIGEWMEARGIRDQLVIATKYTSNFKRGDPNVAQKVNYVGNSTKSLHISLTASLRKLRTSYIDVLYVHWWDWGTSVEETMRALHRVVLSGQVLYLGASDMPAWVVAKANQYARDHGMTPFSIYQGQWNVMKRSFEREIIPMAREEGLALAPWDVLGAGKIRTDAEEAARRETGENGRMTFNPDWERTPDERKVCAALEVVAGQVGVTSIQAVAIAYLMHKTTHVFPIIGGRKVEHLEANIAALDIALSPEQIAYLEAALPFDVGFPASMIGTGLEDPPLLKSAAHMDRWPLRQPILPVKKSGL
ncbi:hypothetical protein HETIRDRAFT_412466 [Heterobasidion irregulare TC 32-1]|uniref:NADP-dependent oxidoreductase domain-containing protein n=1 Tax=Heterobasidion irregulare (strain TC 32-1) TaxID=747525 RepID=W4JP22_HETIT|nr:uncharacterized protein HETIRDRAFT_412466 [Heterobasidion irregulare TC 32-1]ETW75273.1 hypothetical protein HETIRDRAFT_412466 [Heterobasidion irregulare TC 32-1]